MVISRFAKAWILILAAALIAGLLGIAAEGWRHPGDTIGCAVWVLLAACVGLIVRRENQSRGHDSG